MKKYIVFALALTLGFSAVAQKKELKTAKKALAKGDFEKAEIALDAAEVFLVSMEDKYKSQYYLSKSIFYSKRNPDLSINADFENLKKAIAALEFVTNPADAKELQIQQQQLRAHLVNTGSLLLDKNDFMASSNYFESAYNISPSDTIYLYYAASTAVNAKQYDRSLSIYETLRALEFTGIEKVFYATNLKTNKQESFNSETLMSISVKAGTHANPSEEFSESKFPEIIKNIALIYMQNGDNDKALEALAVARAGDPNSSTLIISEANVYFKMGNMDKFRELLTLAVQNDPENPPLLLNLGLAYRDIGENDTAKDYFERVIKLNPKLTTAHVEIANLIITSANEMGDKMNVLDDKIFYGKASRAEKKQFDEFKVKRNELLMEATKSLENSLVGDPDNVEYHKLLYQIFSKLGIEDKEEFHQAKYKSLIE